MSEKEKVSEIEQYRKTLNEITENPLTNFQGTGGVLIRQSEFDWLVKQAKSLYLAKDKHALIKANVELNLRIEEMKDESETIWMGLNEALHEVRVLKNKLNKFNKIYKEQLTVIENAQQNRS